MLFWPFRYVLLLAVIVVVVSQPIHRRVVVAFRGRRTIAAIVTTLGLLTLVFAPAALVIAMAANEATPVVARIQTSLAAPGRIEAWTASIEALRGRLPEFARSMLPTYTAEAMRSSLDDIGNQLIQTISSAAPDLVKGVFAVVIRLVILVFAVVSLFVEGPRLRSFLMRIWPIDDAYERRLFAVFARTSHDVIVSSFAAACAQGLSAALCFRIAGLERVALLGLLTGVCAYIPVLGTALVWVPVALAVYVERGGGWAAFVVCWSVGITGTLDNIIKPMLVRGTSGIHPLLVFLGVFGGLAWMGLPGLLVGPIVVALFLALCEIYEQDFLEPAATVPRGNPSVP